MDIGIDSFAALMPGSPTAPIPVAHQRMADLIEEIEVADAVGLHSFGVGEHHRIEFIDSAPVVILAAAAARTRRIRLHSSVSVLGAADPVRLFQEFATLDLISRGRAEIIVGRGSSIEAFPLFGQDLNDYDELFRENLDLLLYLRAETYPHWSGRCRAPLSGQGIFPRPMGELPIWLGVGGTPASFVRAGTLGLPLMVAIIGGSFARFRPLVDLYRQAGLRAGHPPETLKVGVHAVGFVGPTAEAARDAFYPGWHYMWAQLGKERGWPHPTREQFEAMCSAQGAYIVGDPRTVADKIDRLGKTLGGVSRVNLQMSSASGVHDAMLESIRLLGSEVAPMVNGTIAS